MSPVDLSRRHYQAMAPAPDGEDHPVDRLLAADEDLVTVEREVRLAAARMNDPVLRADQDHWIRYEDLLVWAKETRDERFFDCGYEFGRVAGLAESLSAGGRDGELDAPSVQAFRRDVRKLVLTAPIKLDVAMAALLEVARALVLERP
jgi:hypothetical protein